MVFKGEIFKNKSILTSKLTANLLKAVNTYTSILAIHPALKTVSSTLRTNSLKTRFKESLVKFKQCLRTHGHPKTIIERSLSGMNFASRPSALTQKKRLMRGFCLL